MGDSMFRKPGRYWRNLSIFTLTLILFAAILFGVTLAYSRAMILVHPGRTIPLRTPSDVGLDTWREVSFQSSDGIQLIAWYIPVTEDLPSPTLIYVHGLGSNREGLLNQARVLYEHGYSALLLDLRNHGDRIWNSDHQSQAHP